MRIENEQLKEFIKDAGMVEDGELEASFKEAQDGKKKLGEIIRVEDDEVGFWIGCCK